MNKLTCSCFALFVFVFVIVNLSSAPVWSADRVPDSWRGDWTGWAYGSGLDFPLRMTIGASVRVWSPAAESLLASPTKVEDAGTAGWSIHGDAPGRGEYELTLREEPSGRITGSGRIGSKIEFSLELLKSAVELDPSPTASTSKRLPAGDYVGDNGDLIRIQPRSWGEAVVDWNGARRTLFWTGKRSFMIGSALYAANEVSATGEIVEQSGQPTSIRLNRNGAEIVALPTTFAVRAVETDSDGRILRGSLLIPSGEGPWPAVVIIGGSDWTTRADTDRYARHFAAMGIAALSYDRAGEGESEGDKLEWLVQTGRDAAAMARQLRGRSEIRTDAVGVAGISRGGWSAPLAAVIDSEIAYVIGFVAPSVSPEVQETTRRLHELRATGRSEEELTLARTYLSAFSDYAALGSGWERYEKLHADMCARGWHETLGGTADRYEPGWAWSRLNWRYDPVPTIEQLVCPTLVVLGAEDPNVTPVENEPRWRTALERAPTEAWSVVQIEGADHGYRLDGLVPGRAARIHDSLGRSPRVWTTVRDWLERNGVRR